MPQLAKTSYELTQLVVTSSVFAGHHFYIFSLQLHRIICTSARILWLHKKQFSLCCVSHKKLLPRSSGYWNKADRPNLPHNMLSSSHIIRGQKYYNVPRTACDYIVLYKIVFMVTSKPVTITMGGYPDWMHLCIDLKKQDAPILF